jgi:hypothetical protein
MLPVLKKADRWSLAPLLVHGSQKAGLPSQGFPPQTIDGLADCTVRHATRSSVANITVVEPFKV